MKIDVEKLINDEEQFAARRREARERYLERLRASAFPAPSPFGVDWEKRRVMEARNLVARWSRGRKKSGYDVREFKYETLRIFRVVLDCT